MDELENRAAVLEYLGGPRVIARVLESESGRSEHGRENQRCQLRRDGAWRGGPWGWRKSREPRQTGSLLEAG